MTKASKVDLVRTAELSDRAPYAYASVVSAASGLVITAGASPIDIQGSTVAAGGIREQADKAVDNLELALRAAGAGLGDVAKTTIYVASDRQEDLQAVWEVVRNRFGDHDAPSTLLGVSVLGYRDQLVEIEAVAAI